MTPPSEADEGTAALSGAGFGGKGLALGMVGWHVGAGAPGRDMCYE